MKKLSLVLASALLMGSISFAQTAPATTKAAPAKTEKKAKGEKKGGKSEKKAKSTTATPAAK